MFDIWNYLYGYSHLSWYYPAPRALTANQRRVKKIKRKARALKMLKSKKGKKHYGFKQRNKAIKYFK